MTHRFLTIVCVSCGDFFDIPVYCGDRFCPICSVARRMRVRNRIEFLINNVDYIPRYGFKHLTLTIKNQKNLSVMVGTIVKSFKKLRETDSWKKHVLGGAFVIEITGKSGNWHVHLHIIIQSLYYKFEEILKHWMAVSPGRGVFIQNIPKWQIVRYLTKYISKTETQDTDREELNHALKGTRLFQCFGTWFAINKKFKSPPKRCGKCNDPCFLLYSQVFEGETNFYDKEV